MRARDLATETWEALESNRGRSLLTVLGIVIGISAVIAMTALIGGLKQGLIGELGLSQARTVYMMVSGANQVKTEDLQKIQEGIPDYETVTGLAYAGGTIATKDKSEQASILGVEPAYFSASAMKVQSGRIFSKAEEDAGATVVMMDETAARQLFGSEAADAVGKKVTINSAEYTVSGILQASGAMSEGSIAVYVPLKTCTGRISGYDMVDQTIGIAKEGTDIDALVTKTTEWLAKYYNIPSDEVENAVYVYSMKQAIDQLNSVMASFQILMTAVASISLLVGGIGIMNMMLTNVTERIREIGLRKALGARSSDITKQFLLESICLCVAGGIIGIAVGYLGAYVLSYAAAGFLQSSLGQAKIVPVIDAPAVAVAVGICILIGIVFGYYPARRAAKLDPVESLHYQ